MWFRRTFDSIQYVKLIFKCSKSTSKKYDFKKSNTHFSSPWVLDYTCKKVKWSVEPDYQKYPSFKAMSGCQNKRSILNFVPSQLYSYSNEMKSFSKHFWYVSDQYHIGDLNRSKVQLVLMNNKFWSFWFAFGFLKSFGVYISNYSSLMKYSFQHLRFHLKMAKFKADNDVILMS